MKISVIIIAHNEEQHLKECLDSLMRQTVKPHEIVLIAHNCSDKTVEIAAAYPVIVVNYNGPAGIVYARLEGLKHVTGDSILCIDGDSVAKENWVEKMSEALKQNQNILVGSWIQFSGTLFGAVANIWNKYICVSKNEHATHWLWGASFGFWNRDSIIVKEILEKSILLTKELNLSRNPDDYWLALFMSKRGNLEITNKTWVTQYTKEQSTKEAYTRNNENMRNGKLMREFFKKYN